MSSGEHLVKDTNTFSNVVEAKIEARDGMFVEPNAFLSIAFSGLIQRLGDDFADSVNGVYADIRAQQP